MLRKRSIFAVVLLVVIGGLSFSSCEKQSDPPVSKAEPPSAAETPKQPAPGGHFHADGTWHAEPHAPQPSPEQRADTAPRKNEDLTPIPWQEAKQRLLERKAAAAKKTQVIPAATWEGRKQQVAADPDLIWQLNFVVPDPYLDPDDYTPLGELYDYHLTYEVDIPKNTESQRQRLEPLQSDWRNNDDPEEDKRLRREIVAIEVEGLDTLTAAKYIKSALHEDEIAVEYAERAVRETPTAEAYHVLAWVHWGVDDEASESALRRSLSIDPNYVRVLRDLAVLIWERQPAEAIRYFQRAADLDSRVHKNNYFIGQCYERLGRYEKALEVYQSMPFIAAGMGSWGAVQNIMAIQEGAPRIKPLGTD